MKYINIGDTQNQFFVSENEMGFQEQIQSAIDNGAETREILDQVIEVIPEPDWEGLKNRALGGELYPIFHRLTLASLAPDANTISTARGDITDAILIVKIEAALVSGLQLLTQIGGYQFTQEEKDLWKTVVDELGFSSLVYLP